MVEFDLQGYIYVAQKMIFEAQIQKLNLKLERKTAVKIVRLKVDRRGWYFSRGK